MVLHLSLMTKLVIQVQSHPTLSPRYPALLGDVEVKPACCGSDHITLSGADRQVKCRHQHNISETSLWNNSVVFSLF